MKKTDSPKITALNCPNCGAAATDAPTCAYCDSSLYARVCANCFSAVGITMNHCPKCGSVVAELQNVPQKCLKCPACANALEIHENGHHPIYACAKCGGLWLDHDSFQLICDRVERQALEQGYKLPDLNASTTGKPRRAYIPCPECGIIMTPKNFARCSGIIIDCCLKHGNWFDWQELNRVVEFIQKGGMGKSRIFELQRAKEDARREQSNRMIACGMKKFLSDPFIKAPTK